MKQDGVVTHNFFQTEEVDVRVATATITKKFTKKKVNTIFVYIKKLWNIII